MSNPTLDIYVLSLEQSVARREALARRFHRFFSTFHVINAIDGRDLDAKTYFNNLSNYYLRTKGVMTPSELGCTLSHAKALDTFLKSAATHALIFEDDVIGSDELVDQAKSLTNKIPDNGVLLLGCQDGLKSVRWQYGKRLPGTNMYKVCKFSYKYVYRSCAYIVTKKSAQSILSRLNDPALADEWAYLSQNNIDMYFVKLFSHPVELKDSAIESERALFYIYKKFWMSRFWDLKFYSRNITMMFFIVIALVSGNRKI
jgi:glycosyl transferase family 25